MLFGSAVLLSAQALACSCEPLPPIDQRVREATVIFDGVPTRLESDGDWLVTIFRVDETFKGDAIPERRIFQTTDTNCTLIFPEGGSRVFATEIDGKLVYGGNCDLQYRPDATDENIRRAVKEQAEEAK